MKILIVKLGAIGDVLRTTSLLSGLKEKYPEAQIDWLTSTISTELLSGNSHLNNACAWEDRSKLGDYDLIIGLEDGQEVCQFVSSLKAKKIIGAYYDDGKVTYTPSGWFDMSIISQYGLEKANKLKRINQKTYQQHMADLLGIKVSPYVFSLTAEEIEYGKKVVEKLGLAGDKNVYGINTGAGKRWPQKSWGTKQTIDLVNRLKKEQGINSIILGGQDERERNQEIAKATGMTDAGVHSLRGFASVINQCSTILSSDSLAMHFAIALKKKMVVFFGPTSAAEIELYGLGKKLMPKIDCTVCYQKSCEIKPNCMDLLTVDEVYASLI
ncbi:MAG: glycosyltransferase family 9 protein [bacterium]